MTKTDFFHNKYFLITGASSGIGQAVAYQLAAQGAHLFLLGRNEARLQQTANHCQYLSEGGRFECFLVDLEQEEAIKAILPSLKNLDGLVLSSGKIDPFPAAYLTAAKVSAMLQSNFLAPVLTTSLLLKHKKINPNSSIVFISSISSQFPHLGGTTYSASKAALEAYMRNIALEHADKKIRANALLPGMVKTPLFEEAVQNSSAETMQEHLEKYPLGVGYPDDIANACLFLLSDASRWITGTSLLIDGGLHLGKI